MAKKSSTEKNERRKRMVTQFAAKRKALKGVVQNPKSSEEERRAAQLKLAKLPRNSAKERVRNRCSMTGRSRGYVAAFGLSRMAFRDLALMGMIPGVRKASW